MACTDYVASIMEHLYQSEVRRALFSSIGTPDVKQHLACLAQPCRGAHTLLLHWYVQQRHFETLLSLGNSHRL